MNDEKGITITDAFQKILDESNRKTNKILVDKGSEFYNKSTKLWLEKCEIEIIQHIMKANLLLLKNSLEPWKMKFINTWLQFRKTFYIYKLDDIVNKYNNTYHSTIKIKPVDVKSNTRIDASKEIDNKNPKFKIGDIARISKYKNIFAKRYTPNWS